MLLQLETLSDRVGFGPPTISTVVILHGPTTTKDQESGGESGPDEFFVLQCPGPSELEIQAWNVQPNAEIQIELHSIGPKWLRFICCLCVPKMTTVHLLLVCAQMTTVLIIIPRRDYIYAPVRAAFP